MGLMHRRLCRLKAFRLDRRIISGLDTHVAGGFDDVRRNRPGFFIGRPNSFDITAGATSATRMVSVSARGGRPTGITVVADVIIAVIRFGAATAAVVQAAGSEVANTADQGDWDRNDPDGQIADGTNRVTQALHAGTVRITGIRITAGEALIRAEDATAFDCTTFAIVRAGPATDAFLISHSLDDARAAGRKKPHADSRSATGMTKTTGGTGQNEQADE